MNDHFLWVEKYRPRTVDDCVLPEEQKTFFKQALQQGEIQNMLLCGTAGTGKTTIARALCEELKTDYIIINGSEESGIDVLRTKIKDFASTVSFTGNTKVVILDEADGISSEGSRALRNVMEEYSGNTRFILTANYKHKIITPIQSRCQTLNFDHSIKDVAKHCFNILQKEKISYLIG